MAGLKAYSGLRVIGQPVKWIAADIRRIYKGRDSGPAPRRDPRRGCACVVKERKEKGGSLETQSWTRVHVPASRSLVLRGGVIPCANRDNTPVELDGPSHTRNTRSKHVRG